MFFTRHMRVLEQCISSATPEMQAQINALREAFSKDTSKPFELKPSLGLRSPLLENHPTPPELRHGSSGATAQTVPSWSHLQDATSSKTISPVSDYEQAFEHINNTHGVPVQRPMAYSGGTYQLPSQATYASQTLQQVTAAPQTGYTLQPIISNEQQVAPAWDPSGIFNQ